MRAMTLLLGASVVCAGLAGPNAASAQPAGSANATEADESRAKMLFEAERYAEAAAAFEALWEEHRAPKLLFNAALAREMAGHELHAFIHLQRYLALATIDTPARALAEERLLAQQDRTVRIRVVVSPPTVASEHLFGSFVRDASDASGTSPVVMAMDGLTFSVLAAPGRPGTYDLQMEPGSWTLELAAPGHNMRRLALSVVRADTVMLELEATEQPAPQPSSPTPRPSANERGERPRRLSLALGLSGVVLAGTGAGLLVGGYRAASTSTLDLSRYTSEEQSRYHGYLSEGQVGRAHDLIGSGALLLGTAGGLWVGAATTAARPGRTSMLALLGTGLALGVAGGISYSATWSQSRAPDFADDDGVVVPNSWGKYKRQIVGSNIAAGLGLGMAASALIGLVTNRLVRAPRHRVAVQPAFSRSGVSLAAHWRF